MLLKSKDLAYLGVLLGLNQVFIVLSSLIETNTLFLFAVAALIVGIVIVEFGAKSSLFFYIASSILGYILTFNKIEIITYILFFGLYSIIKHLLETKVLGKKSLILAKITSFNITLVIIYLVTKLFTAIPFEYWMILLAQVLFLVYDYAFTVFINYYIDKIKPKLNFRK